MNIAVIDDTMVDRKLLTKTLKDYLSANGLDADISVFENADDFIKDYRPLMYTVVFMDIFMTGMNGVEAAMELRKQDLDTILVFLTSSGEHRPEAFSAHAYDYLQKPVDRKRLFALMDDIMKLRPESGKAFTFLADRTEQSIPFSEITAVRSDGHYLEINDRSGESYRTRLTFSAAEDQLSKDSRFLLVLRGVIVNMDHILSFSDDGCELTGGIKLPINVRNSRRLEQIWKNYLFAKVRRETMMKGGGL